MFWQPFYFTGQGHHLHVNGNLDDNIIRLLKGNLVLAGIGEADLSGVVDRSANTVRDLDLRADNLELSALFSQVLKPFLANASFTGLKAEGHAGIQLRYRNGASELLALSLRDVSIEDERERFAFRGVNANIPWQAHGMSVADIGVQSSQVARIPLGEFRVPLEINGQDLAIPRMTIPVLDGEFMLENFRASRQAQDWHWQFSGGLSPVHAEADGSAEKPPNARYAV